LGFTKTNDQPAEAALIASEKIKADLQAQKLNIEQERVARLQEKEAQESLGYDLKVNIEKSTDTKAYIEIPATSQQYAANVVAATGCANKAGYHILAQTISAMNRASYSDPAADMMQTTQESLIAMKPNDIQEGLLCSRMITLHNHAMALLQAAAHPDSNSRSIDFCYKNGMKLMRLANEHLEALNRHRRKGEQKVTVTHQHVTVNEGGQAVVAGDFNGGRGDGKN
jgi:hypothetical protein